MTGQISKSGINQTSDMVKIISGYIDAKGQVTGKEKELEELFDEVSYYNSGSDGAKKIQEQIDRLEKGIQALKEEAEKLQSDIEQKNLKIDDKAEKIADIISKINAATMKHQQAVAKAVKDSTRDALIDYKKGKGDYAELFYSAFDRNYNVTGVSMTGIQQMFADCDGVKEEISGLADEIKGIIDNELTPLETKLKNTNATANLLNLTKDNLATQIQDAYKNVDTDNKKAIYSGKKAEVADKILQTEYDGNLSNIGNTASQDALKAEFLEKYKEKNADGDKVDVYRLYVDGEEKDNKGRVGNKALNGLGKALDDDMWEKLQDSGMSCDDIMTWISTEWNVGLKQKDGKWEIPAGHGKSGHQEANKNYLDDATGSSKIYKKLEDLYDKGDSAKTANSVSKENISKLYDAMNPKDGSDDVLTTMYKNGFTFKEAMCVIDEKFGKDCGIEYDLDKQSSGRNYSMVKDSSASGGLYSKIASEIQQYWNVGSTDITTTSSNKIGTTPEAGDPITFRQGNTMYTFIDASDGKFDYNSENDNDLLGSKNGIEDLKAFDLDGNGSIEGDELKNLTIMANKQDESVGTQEDVNKYKDGSNYKNRGIYTNAVDFNVSYTTAADLGITKIDLNKIQEGPGAVDSVAHTDVLNTIEIETDGKQLDSTITAQQTNDKKEYLETFYKQVAKNANGSKNNEKIYSAINHEDFTKAMSLDNAYNADASAANSILKSVRSELESALSDAEGVDPEKYGLNMDFQTFKDLYSSDKYHYGKYIQGAQQRAINLVEGDKNNKGYLDTGGNSETSAATGAVKQEVGYEDNNHNWVTGSYQKENMVKMKKDEKKENE